MTDGWSARLKTWAKGGRGQKLLIAVGAVAMGLILLSELLPEKPQATEAPTAASVTAEEYAKQLETRLAEIVGGIEGVNGCRVMVTLENGVEYRYASEQKSGSNYEENSANGSSRLSQKDDSEQSVILVDTGDGRGGLLVTEVQPTVKGVMVVCGGGQQPEVQQRVTEAVTTVLNITSKRVCVIPAA